MREHQLLLLIVFKGKVLRTWVQRKFDRRRARVFDRISAHHFQLGGGIGRLHQGHGVGINILNQTDILRKRRHLEISRQDPQIMAVARTKHDAMLPQGYRLGIAVVGRVGDIKIDGHR